MIAMRTLQKWIAGAGMALGLVLTSGVAQARDVYWSVGVGAPGVGVNVGNGPGYYAPAPVYYAPPPVVYAPPPPVYYRPPRPVYYAPAPVVVEPYGYYRGPRHGHGHGHGHGRDRDHRRDWR